MPKKEVQSYERLIRVMAILVTGANGYIGSQLVGFLESSGESVVSLDLEDYNSIRVARQQYTGDIRVQKLLEHIFQTCNIEIVVHLAALKSVPESILFPENYFSINHQGSVLLAQISKTMNVKFFINISSAAVYGSKKAGVLKENDEANPDSPYGLSKLRAENDLNALVTNSDFKLINLRLFNVAGQFDLSLEPKKNTNLIPIFVEKILSGKNPIIFGNDYSTFDGTCVRDFVHVGDVLNAIKLSIENFRKNREFDSIMNIGSGEGTSVLDIYSKLCIALNHPYQPFFGDRREGDIDTVIGCISRAKETLGYTPAFNLGQMIDSAISSVSSKSRR